ncbi:MAG TPA: leucyl aminopeptidase [Acidimicrobiales bacterium]|nr:leucyl aminopeptidase [Acidimicrobiales bacterium]
MSPLPSFETTTSAPAGAEATGRLVGTGPVALGREGGVSEELARRRGFCATVGERLVLADGERSEILLGAGDPGRFGTFEARRAAAVFARALAGESECVLDLRGVPAPPARDLVQAVVEGVAGASYRFEHYRSARREEPSRRVHVLVDEADLAGAEEGLARGLAVAEAVTFARDVSNRAPGDLTPTDLAEAARHLAASGGVRIEVFDEERIAAERLGGLLGVARGSAEPPRLVKMTYEPDDGVALRGADGRVPTVALVGKGITFDSGGLSLKPPTSMIGMKHDMSGAAAVLATAAACRALGVGVRVVAIAPVTENMPGGRAIKPGDVLTIRNGTTIEVLNTDAEGRLVLSDGLVLATEEEPDAIVDVATLTGACVVALGAEVAGVMGNDSVVLRALEEAARRAGEPVWRLPLPRSYRRHLDSDIADLKNVGKERQAGALVAGLVLEEFVGERPWAHLDIAGPADVDEARYDLQKGATAFGVRTLLEFVGAFEPNGAAGSRVADHLGVG